MTRMLLIVAIAVIEIVLNGVWIRFIFSFTTHHQVGMAGPSHARKPWALSHSALFRQNKPTRQHPANYSTKQYRQRLMLTPLSD